MGDLFQLLPSMFEADHHVFIFFYQNGSNLTVYPSTVMSSTVAEKGAAFSRFRMGPKP